MITPANVATIKSLTTAEPASILTAEAESSITVAASMIAGGLPAVNVLRCLYLLAFMDGVSRS